MRLLDLIANNCFFRAVHESVGNFAIGTASRIVDFFSNLCGEKGYKVIPVLSIVIVVVIGISIGLLAGILIEALLAD